MVNYLMYLMIAGFHGLARKIFLCFIVQEKVGEKFFPFLGGFNHLNSELYGCKAFLTFNFQFSLKLFLCCQEVRNHLSKRGIDGRCIIT